MQDENMGTAMVTPASASAYCSARLPKKMQKPEAMAKPIEGPLFLRHVRIICQSNIILCMSSFCTKPKAN